MTTYEPLPRFGDRVEIVDAAGRLEMAVVLLTIDPDDPLTSIIVATPGGPSGVAINVAAHRLEAAPGQLKYQPLRAPLQLRAHE